MGETRIVGGFGYVCLTHLSQNRHRRPSHCRVMKDLPADSSPADRSADAELMERIHRDLSAYLPLTGA